MLGRDRLTRLENAFPVKRGSVIYAKDVGERNDVLLELHPDRSAFRARCGELAPLPRRSDHPTGPPTSERGDAVVQPVGGGQQGLPHHADVDELRR